MSSKKLELHAIIGASGSGKSIHVKTKLLKPAPRRLLVWDFKREYSEWATPTEKISDVVRAVRDAKTFAVAFWPSMDTKKRGEQFDQFCRIAYAVKNCTLLVEELAFVTKPGWAPPAWMMMTCTGRHEGIRIIGTSQRPAQVDKNFLGNATVLHCGRLQDKNDVRVMSDLLFVDRADLVQLQPLEYIERDMQTGQNRRGKVIIPARTGPPAKKNRATKPDTDTDTVTAS